MRGHDRSGRGTEYRAHRGRLYSRGLRMRRSGYFGYPGRADRGRAQDNRGRSIREQTRDGETVRRDRHDRRIQYRGGQDNQGDDRGRSGLLFRGGRAKAPRRAVLRRAASGRYGDHNRHDTGRAEGRDRRAQALERAENPGHQHGQQPFSHRHASLYRLLPAGPAQPGRHGEQTRAARERERGVRIDEEGRSRAHGPDVRLRQRQTSGAGPVHSATGGGSTMEYRQFGETGIKISAVGVGCWEIGGGYGSIEETDFIKAVGRALDQGINSFDTAEAYGFGASEKSLAKALGARRKEAVITTKFGVGYT